MDKAWIAEQQNSFVISFYIRQLHLQHVTSEMAEVTADGGSSVSSVISSITGEISSACMLLWTMCLHGGVVDLICDVRGNLSINLLLSTL